MKKTLLSLLFLLAIPALIMAHPPKKVKLSYAEGELVIEVLHSVSDASTHYIDEISIFVDGVEYKNLRYKSQTSNESLIVEVKVDGAKKGSVIKVKANCNKMGVKTAKLKVK